MAEKLENEARQAATKAATKREAATHACSEEEVAALWRFISEREVGTLLAWAWLQGLVEFLAGICCLFVQRQLPKLNNARHGRSNRFVSCHGLELLIWHPSHSHSPLTKTAKLRKEQQAHADSEEASADHESEEGGDKAQGSKAKRARAE